MAQTLTPRARSRGLLADLLAARGSRCFRSTASRSRSSSTWPPTQGHRHGVAAARGSRRRSSSTSGSRPRRLSGRARTCPRGSFATARISRRCSPGSRGGHPRAVRAGRRRAPSRGRVPGRRRSARGDGRGRARSSTRIGITGYPESHHLISDEETIRAMFVKAEMATDIVSQLCFDPATIAWWIGAVRARGTRACRSGSACPAAWTTRKLRADLDEDRHGRVGALPEPPARLGVAPADAAVQARPAAATPWRR